MFCVWSRHQLDKQIVRRFSFSLQESTGLLVGDVLLSAACIAYYGAFPGKYRQELVSGWVDKCREYGIPVSPDCTLRGTLASPIQVYPNHCMSLHVHSCKFPRCQLACLPVWRQPLQPLHEQ